MNTFELNKIAGAVLGTILLVMGLGFVAEALYAPDHPAVPGYTVELADEGGGEAAETKPEAAPEMSLAALLGGGDAARGAKQMKKCAACHTYNDGGAKKVGPNLHGIVGRKIATSDGFGYSDAMKTFAADNGSWTYENLNGFLANPKSYLPGTKMSFGGLKKDKPRADLIVFLKDQSPDAPDLPAEKAAMEDATTEVMETAKDASAPAEPAKDAATADTPAPASMAEPAMAEPAMAEPSATETPAAEPMTEKMPETPPAVAEGEVIPKPAN